MLKLAEWIAGLFGVTDIFKIKRWMSIALIVLLLVVLMSLGLFLRSCLNHKPKPLTEEQQRVAKQAIADGDRKTMVEVLTNSTVEEKQIDANLANAKAETVNAIQDARKNAEQLSNEQLAEELNKRANQ